MDVDHPSRVIRAIRARHTVAGMGDAIGQVLPLAVGVALSPLPIVAQVRAQVPRHLEPLAQSVLLESLRNVQKHARPTRVDVRVDREEGAFILEVANDGAQGRASASTGMGLRLAAFEALQQGGFVEFGEREPGVWKVRLVVPVTADE